MSGRDEYRRLAADCLAVAGRMETGEGALAFDRDGAGMAPVIG